MRFVKVRLFFCPILIRWIKMICLNNILGNLALKLSNTKNKLKTVKPLLWGNAKANFFGYHDLFAMKS